MCIRVPGDSVGVFYTLQKDWPNSSCTFDLENLEDWAVELWYLNIVLYGA